MCQGGMNDEVWKIVESQRACMDSSNKENWS
jgi:hypothetical protein